MTSEANAPRPPEQQGRQAPGVPASAPVLLCRVVDDLLPSLKDTELRLLLVVLRQTLLRNKRFDWLASRQLKERTGRASEAVSAAIDALVTRGLLEVRNEQGRLLSTPQQRRREQGRLFFRLGPALLGVAPVASVASEDRLMDTARDVFDFPKTTGSTYKENCRLRKPNTQVPPAPVAGTPELSAAQRARIEQEKERIRQRLAALGQRAGSRRSG